MANYDVFISYRRSGGEYTAKILRDRLEDMGYRVFFDVESLRSGYFNNRFPVCRTIEVRQSDYHSFAGVLEDA